MKINVIVFVFFVFFIFCSCNSSKSTFVDDGKIEYEEILVIKFMGTITTQPYAVMEKSFWAFKEEHTFLKINNNDFIEDVKRIRNNYSAKFREYNYAFIVKNKKEIDTLYSDNSLKTWIFKKNNKEVYYYDEEGKIAENLRNTYSFFRECW